MIELIVCIIEFVNRLVLLILFIASEFCKIKKLCFCLQNFSFSIPIYKSHRQFFFSKRRLLVFITYSLLPRPKYCKHICCLLSNL